MRRIHPYPLWIGHAGDGRGFRRLHDEGIRAIVQLALEEEPLVAPREFILLRCPLHDGGNESGVICLAVKMVVSLIQLEIPSLICCSAGMSRSPAVVAAALAQVERRSSAECLDQVTMGGPADVSATLWQELCGIVL